MSDTSIGIVVESTPTNILIEIESKDVFEKNKQDFQIGKYLKVENGNNQHIVTLIQNVKAIHATDNDNRPIFRFQINTQPIGVTESSKFKRGNITLPVPTEPAYLLNSDELDLIYINNEEYNVPFGKLRQNNDIDLHINGNKFFSKHIAVVGSTGSGKSCAVSKILQQVVGIDKCQNLYCENQKNSHVVIFDIHSEYASAFTLDSQQMFTLNTLNVDNLKLPYWLMNAEELETMFIESSEANSYNQVSQFKNAVILNKEKYNHSIRDITYDTPVYFSIEEVCNYIENLNEEVIGKLEGENLPKLTDGTLVTDRSIYFDKVYNFVQTSTAKVDKASIGPFHGEFNRFILRLRARIADKRLKFLFKAEKSENNPYETEDFPEIMKQFLGYINKANISIVDLSGIPFEVLNITISLVSRLIFDFCFHYSKIKHDENLLNNIPVMIVCEEAHNYVPRNGGVQYAASKKSIERIAKEGRKYGLSLMVVSQRPSEVSETIFAQCNNFIALRLTNSNDQSYIRSLMPDNTSGIADLLPNLSSGEYVIVGDAVILPSVAKLDLPNPEPKSQSINFYNEWREDWKDVDFDEIIKRWRKEEIK